MKFNLKYTSKGAFADEEFIHFNTIEELVEWIKSIKHQVKIDNQFFYEFPELIVVDYEDNDLSF